MKFFHYEPNFKLGMCMVHAWISIAKRGDRYWFVSISLPLFVLRWCYNLYSDTFKYGWYNPTFRVRFTLTHPLELRTFNCFLHHSDFMGEVKEVQGYPHA